MVGLQGPRAAWGTRRVTGHCLSLLAWGAPWGRCLYPSNGGEPRVRDATGVQVGLGSGSRQQPPAPREKLGSRRSSHAFPRPVCILQMPSKDTARPRAGDPRPAKPLGVPCSGLRAPPGLALPGVTDTHLLKSFSIFAPVSVPAP